MEFSPSFWNEYIVFVGARSRQKLFDKKINEAYFDLYYSAVNKNDQLEKTALLSKSLNTEYHEGPASFFDDGSSIIYSGPDKDRGFLVMNEEGDVLNVLYESRTELNDWTKPIKSSVNIEGYTSCHPTVNSKGNYLIFSSDRPGGYGKMDLYISHKDQNGTWGEAINLGPKINSEEVEVFPYINQEGYLFYASHTKDGDLDIYRTRITDLSISENPIRLPHPINSDADDFGLILNETGRLGYMTSTRKGGRGKDDIYKIISTKSIYGYGDEGYNTIIFTVSSNEQNKKISDVNIYWRRLDDAYITELDLSKFDLEDESFNRSVTNEKGEVLIKLEEGFNQIIFQHDNYVTLNKLFASNQSTKTSDIILEEKTESKKDTIIRYIPQENKKTINNVEVKAGALLIFNNIYYDYNSHEIKKGAARELDELAAIMIENRDIKILLTSHTDSRGKADYNLLLSEKRAQSAKSYLTSKGVLSHNIRTIGLGESQLRNHCKDDVYCSEADHIYNRRTEVRILE